MKNLFFVFSFLGLAACSNSTQTDPKSVVNKSDTITFNILFGSCAHQDKPQPLLNIATDIKPDAFVYLGDNIYGDTYSMDSLKAKYKRLGEKEEFQKLQAATEVLAVWDDHDYGQNDAGRHYPLKQESEAIFLDFWQVDSADNRRNHPGTYGVHYIEKEGKKVQILLLDTRYFRDDLVYRTKNDTVGKNDYIPNEVADSTVLGEAQWNWLKQQLTAPADLRIIASSIQFGHEYNGWESWTNIPHEQNRFLNLIANTKANHVLFISGDVHWGEISKMENEFTYPIYDITSSGITQTWYNVEPNKNRLGEAVRHNNIGSINLVFINKEVKLELGLIDSTGQKIRSQFVDYFSLEN